MENRVFLQSEDHSLTECTGKTKTPGGLLRVFIESHRLSKLNNKPNDRECATDLGGYVIRRAYQKLLRKEVIHPHLPVRIPCYDFTPVINHSLDGCLPKVSSPASGAINSHGVTGGVYKARERIHRVVLIRDY